MNLANKFFFQVSFECIFCFKYTTEWFDFFLYIRKWSRWLSSYHLSPYRVIKILIIFPSPYIMSPLLYFFYSWKFVPINLRHLFLLSPQIPSGSYWFSVSMSLSLFYFESLPSLKIKLNKLRYYWVFPLKTCIKILL